MKKLIALSLATTMSLSTVAFADTKTTTEDDLQVMPISAPVDDIVPAREYAEGLGYDVEWNADNKSITFTKLDNVFKATVNSTLYFRDLHGKYYEPETMDLGAPTTIVDGTAYIPQSFAKLLFDIPVVEPEPSEPPTTITPEVPVIDDVDTIDSVLTANLSTEVAEKIAVVIEDKLQELVDEQIKANEEYKEAFLSTGGTLEEYVEPSYEIGYEILSSNDEYTSVKVYRYQALASSFTEEIYYTFDSQTAEQLSLESFLGEGYEDYVKDEVIETAKQREIDEPEMYQYDEQSLEDLVIDDTTSFYINEDGEVVVVFAKYELAAGVYGEQEFIIE